MDTVNEANMAMIENNMERDGIQFKLNVTDMSDTLYDELICEILAHIGKFTDADVKYVGDWDITIKVKDVEFE